MFWIIELVRLEKTSNMSEMFTLFPEWAFHGSSGNYIVCVYDGKTEVFPV